MAFINKILGIFGMKIYRDDPIGNAVRFIETKEEENELVGVEIGTYKGKHAKAILENLNIKKLYLVDPYTNYENYDDYGREDFNKLFKEAMKRLSKFKDKTLFIRKKSSEALEEIPDNLDFVYIDGNHTYEYAKKDMEDYYKKLKVGGVLSGHDTYIEGVLKALIEFVNEKKLKLLIFGNDWWCVKE